MITARIRTVEGEMFTHKFKEDKVKYVYRACLKMFGGCSRTIVDGGQPVWVFQKASVSIYGDNLKIKAGYRTCQ